MRGFSGCRRRLSLPWDGRGGARGITLDRTATICDTDVCGHPGQGGAPVPHLTVDGGGRVTITGNSGESFHTAPYRDLFFKGRALSVSGGTVE